MTTPPPYTPAVVTGNFVFVSGQIGKDFENNTTAPSIEEQTNQTMKNLKSHLEANGSSLKSLIKTTIFLTDMGQYGIVNDIYASYLSEPYPARTCVAVKELPRVADVDLLIEVEAVATVEG